MIADQIVKSCSRDRGRPSLCYTHNLCKIEGILSQRPKRIWLLTMIIFTLNPILDAFLVGKELSRAIRWFSPSLHHPPPPPCPTMLVWPTCNHHPFNKYLSMFAFFALKSPTPSFVHFNRNTKKYDSQLQSAIFQTLATTTTTCSGASATCPSGYTKDSDGTKCYIRR